MLTIIIPVYNVERYIGGTLSSIYDQNFDESQFEVIVVNDGTPDKSMSVVDVFAKKHLNLRIVNQDNRGLSAARNAGLSIAKGEYVWFVDSDDKIASDSLEKIREIIKKEADIFCFDMTRVSENDDTSYVEKFFFKDKRGSSAKEVAKFDFGIKTHMAPAQRFVFRNNFLKETNLMFYPGIIHEDDEFMIKAVLVAKKICYENYSPYLYLVRGGGSIMSSVSMKSLESKIKIIKSWEVFSTTAKLDEESLWYIDIQKYNEMNSILLKSVKVNGGQELVDKNRKDFCRIAKNCAISGFFTKRYTKMLKALVLFFKLKVNII